jgi:hypothetical protein
MFVGFIDFVGFSEMIWFVELLGLLGYSLNLNLNLCIGLFRIIGFLPLRSLAKETVGTITL